MNRNWTLEPDEQGWADVRFFHESNKNFRGIEGFIIESSGDKTVLLVGCIRFGCVSCPDADFPCAWYYRRLTTDTLAKTVRLLDEVSANPAQKTRVKAVVTCLVLGLC